MLSPQQQQYQSTQTMGFLSPKPFPMKQSGIPPEPTKLYRGVMRRNWGKRKWVAHCRSPPTNGTRLWLGTYDTAKEAALAYDMVAYELHGHLAQLNFPNLRHSGSHIGVGPSTLKGVCLGNNIDKWPPQEEYKLNGQSSPSEDRVFVKAKYGSYIIKFQLNRPWGKAKLEEQVNKRLQEIEPGTYLVKYKDEDGELILITCDEDLQLYIERSRLQGATTSVVVLLERK